MKPKRQRLHSAELRRLDHIAQSLDRIAVVLENLHPINGNDNVVLEQIGGKDNRMARHDINDIKQDGGGNAAFGNVSGDTTTVHGNGQIQHRINESYNTNADEAIKNLITALKQ